MQFVLCLVDKARGSVSCEMLKAPRLMTFQEQDGVTPIDESLKWKKTLRASQLDRLYSRCESEVLCTLEAVAMPSPLAKRTRAPSNCIFPARDGNSALDLTRDVGDGVTNDCPTNPSSATHRSKLCGGSLLVLAILSREAVSKRHTTRSISRGRPNLVFQGPWEFNHEL